jgi:hypothetical protein
MQTAVTQIVTKFTPKLTVNSNVLCDPNSDNFLTLTTSESVTLLFAQGCSASTLQINTTIQTPFRRSKLVPAWFVPTWLARSTTKHTKPTSRQFTVMAGILALFGVQFVPESRSTNFVVLLMHTHMPSVSTLISLGFGLTWAAYTYESCNNQISGAIDAYARASELDPSNHVNSQCL